MTNIDRVRTTLSRFNVGDKFISKEIVDLVKKDYPENIKKDGIINPSDYCYNLVNLGKINDRKLFEFNIFEYDFFNKCYVYLGENYPYSKEILHKPKGADKKPYVIGKWIDGVRVIAPDKINKPQARVDIPQKSSDDHKTKRDPSLSLRYKVLQRDNFKCRICGASPAKDPSVELHIDHIVAWSKGGETEIDNLQTLCSKCNIGKSDSD